MKKKLSLVFSVLLLIAGILIFFYPAISNYVNVYRQYNVVSHYVASSAQIVPEDKEQYLQEAREYNERLLEYGSVEQAITEVQKDSEEYASILNYNQDGVMGTVEIPDLNIYLPIYHGTEKDILKEGAGHYEGSSFPVGGAGTHAVITGHRGLPSADLFTKLDEMEEGDLFFIHVFDETYCYQTDGIQVVEPEEIDSLSIIPGEDRVTLVTCTPYGVNSHRLLIHGIRIPYEEEPEQERIDVDEKLEQYRLVKQMCVGAAILAAVLLTVFLFRKAGKRKGKNK